MFSVYRITNRVNGKMYIGFTKRTVDARWRSHLSSARNMSPFRFHAAIRKYGADQWVVETIAVFSDQSEARKFEEEQIATLGTIFSGYNAKPGGCGGNIVPDDRRAEWREKLSKHNTGAGNGNFSGYSDDDIVGCFLKACADGVFEPGDGLTSAIKKCADVFGTPKTFAKKFRFTAFGGGVLGLRAALANEGLSFPARPVSRERREKIANSIRGRKWYTNRITGETRQSATSPGVDWNKGRKHANY